VVEKCLEQARRLRAWRPRKAAVMGDSTIGLLATLMLRLCGLEIVTFGRTPKPYLTSELIEMAKIVFHWRFMRPGRQHHYNAPPFSAPAPAAFAATPADE